MASASQLSLFSAGMSPVGPSDLEGLLCGPAQLARQGRAVRLSLLLAPGWRVAALAAELAQRGLETELDTAPGLSERELIVVRTPFCERLAGLAARWTSGAGKTVPPGLRLDGARLRLWCIAAGAPAEQPSSWRLGLGAHDAQTWLPVGAALSAAGLAGALVGPRADGPAYRLSGSRRVGRLAELVGAPPDGAPDGGWPRGAAPPPGG